MSLQVFGDDYSTPDGTCLRDYVHVTDLADAHVRALEALVETGTSAAYNLGTGHPHSVREVIDTAGRVTGRQVPWTLAPRRPGDPAVLYAASHKAEAELQWNPHFPDLESIVRTAWEWHRTHPHGYGPR
jgi:UDP-glucose 4-epimerase